MDRTSFKVADDAPSASAWGDSILSANRDYRIAELGEHLVRFGVRSLARRRLG